MRNSTHSAPPILPSINICNNVAGSFCNSFATWQNESETITSDGNSRSSAPPLVVTIDATRARSSYEVLKMCIDALGWKEHIPGSKDHEPPSSDIHWNAVHFSEASGITGGKVNKFPGMVEAVKKVSLGRSLENMRRLFPSEYSFYPKSWFLPQQLHEFRLEASTSAPVASITKTTTCKAFATADAKANSNTTPATSAVHSVITKTTAASDEKNSKSEVTAASPIPCGPSSGKRARVTLGRLGRHRNSVSSSDLLPGSKFTLSSSSSPMPLSSSSLFGTSGFLNTDKSALKSENSDPTSQQNIYSATTTGDSPTRVSPISSSATPPSSSSSSPISHHSETKPHRSSSTVYIIKPDEGSQGEGIYLIRRANVEWRFLENIGSIFASSTYANNFPGMDDKDPKEYVIESDSRKKHVAQEYVAEPLLLDGLKFDLRVYVVLISIEPLTVYMCKEGLARFCTQPYRRPTQRNIHNPFMHLTNYSLNKKSKDYLHTESAHDGSKRSMTNVFRQLKLIGFDVDLIVTQIKDVIVKTLIALLPDLRMEHSRQVPKKYADSISCFQILGFDVLLTSEGKPVLLEVNSSPSLRLDFEFHPCSGVSKSLGSPVDEEVKRRLVMDTLLLIAPKYKVAKGGSSGNSAGVSQQAVQVFKCPQHCGYNSLEKIYPSETDAYDIFMVLDRAARVFFASLSVTDVSGMNSVCFKAFTKKCHIATSTLPGAVLDLIFLDTTRQMGLLQSDIGSHSSSNSNINSNSNSTRILRLQMRDFIHAFICIAQQRYSQQSTKERKGYLRYKKSDKRNLKQLLLANSSRSTQQRLLEYFEMLLLHCESYLNLASGEPEQLVCTKEHRSSLDSANRNQTSGPREMVLMLKPSTAICLGLDDKTPRSHDLEKHCDGRMFQKKESIRSTRKFSRHANLSVERTTSYDGSLFYSSLTSPSSSPNLFSPPITPNVTNGGKTPRMPIILSPLYKQSAGFLPHVSSLPSLNFESPSRLSHEKTKLGNSPKRMHSEKLDVYGGRTWGSGRGISKASDEE